jgi:hypothetical protein
MDDNIRSAHPNTLRALRLRALALAAVAAAGVFFLVVGLGVKHLQLGDITRIQVISGCILFGLGGLLHPNRNGLIISALLWAAFQFFVENGLEFRDDSLSLALGLGVAYGDPRAIAVGVFFAAFTFFLIARFHYIAVLDRSLWRDYDRYVLDHPDFFWWRRHAAPMRRPMKSRSNGTRRGAATPLLDNELLNSKPLTVGFENPEDPSLIPRGDDFWGPRYGRLSFIEDYNTFGLYSPDVDLQDNDPGFIGSTSTDDWP